MPGNITSQFSNIFSKLLSKFDLERNTISEESIVNTVIKALALCFLKWEPPSSFLKKYTKSSKIYLSRDCALLIYILIWLNLFDK